MKNINLGAHFLFLLILCSIKIERLLFLKFLKNLAFFDSYFWPFNKSHEKIIAIFVISAIMASIWNVFIKFRWHDEKLTHVLTLLMSDYLLLIVYYSEIALYSMPTYTLQHQRHKQMSWRRSLGLKVKKVDLSRCSKVPSFAT